MKITNKLNLPQSFIFDDDREFNPNRYSVTELLCSTQEIFLKRKYYNEIEKDVSDTIPALFGSAVHYMLEKNTQETETLKSEYKIEYNIDGVDIVGIIDLLDLNNLTIKDYKTCSVSKITKNDFEDWRLQGLSYAWLVFNKLGVIIRKLKFIAIMKDWSKIKAATSSNYPSAPVYIWEYDISDSDFDFIERKIKNKISEINSEYITECSDSERWYSGTTYAVYKNANDKRATALYDSEQEAHDYITNKLNGVGSISVRKGEYIKCKYYCDVCKFCKQYKEEN